MEVVNHKNSVPSLAFIKNRSCNSFLTPSKIRILTGSLNTNIQQVLRLDTSGTPSIDDSKVLENLKQLYGNSKAIIVSDYGEGCISSNIKKELRKSKIPVFVDSRYDIASYKNVEALIPNEEELERTINNTVISFDDYEVSAQKLLKCTGAKTVLVKRGKHGMSVFVGNKKPEHISAFGDNQLVDVTGAGDTAIATFTLARISGANAITAMKIANIASGIKVTKFGAAGVSSKELSNAVGLNIRK